MNAAIRYRADVDGLRALAVGSVVAFHLNSSLLPAGFAGVDVFFVISGFLLTGIITKELEQSLFDLRNFYLRRIKRILPAASLVIIATICVAHFIMIPQDYVEVVRSGMASQLFSANIYYTFLFETSYFDNSTKVQPFLHYWSLGVEEQFYIFWPVATMLIAKLSARKRILLSFCIVAVSLGVSEWLVHSYPKAAYYLLPSRVWQLAAGGLCFYLLAAARPDVLNKRSVREGLSLVGAGLLAFALLTSDAASFPGMEAVPVTLGTSLLIVSGGLGTTVLSKSLATRALTTIGVLSFAIYLWHWPIFTLYRYVYGVIPPAAYAPMIALVGLLSFVTYSFVERPCRDRNYRILKESSLYFALPTILVCLMFAGTLATNGYGFYIINQRYKLELASNVVDSPNAGSNQKFICGVSTLNNSVIAADLADVSCVINSSDDRTDTLLWGDSHGAHYIGILGEVGREIGFSFRNVGHWACPPLLRNAEDFVPAGRKENCRSSTQIAAQETSNYTTIILGASWGTITRSAGDQFAEELRHTVETLSQRGKTVIVLGNVPGMTGASKRCGQVRAKLQFIDCERIARQPRVGVDRVNEALQGAIAGVPNVIYADVTDQLCDEISCSPYIGDDFVYYDSSHLSMPGSIRIGQSIIADAQLAPILKNLRSLARPAELQSGILPWDDDTARLRPPLQAFLSGEVSTPPVRPSLSDWAVRDDVVLDMSGDSLVIEDVGQTRASAVVRLFDERDHDSEQADTLIVSLRNVESNGAIALRIITKMADDTKKYENVYIDPRIQALGTAKEMDDDQVLVKFGTQGFDVLTTVSIAEDARVINLFVHPSTGEELYKNDPLSTGAVTIDDVEVFLLQSGT